MVSLFSPKCIQCFISDFKQSAFHLFLISSCLQSQETKQDKCHCWDLLQRFRREDEWKVWHQSIRCTIIQLQHPLRDKRKEKLCLGLLPFHYSSPPTPAAAVAYYLSRIKTSGLVLRMSSLNRALRDPIEFQTSYLMLLPDLARLCDLLWIREQWREQRRGGIKEFLLQWSHIPPEITHPSPHPAFLSLL